jgi:hypothetical protein
MRVGIWGALGFAGAAAVMLAALYWLVTRRILVSTTRQKSRPLSVFRNAWRSVFAFIKLSPLVALAVFGTKLFQILGKDIQNIALHSHPMTWSIVGMAIDLVFVLAWAVVALRIYFHILVPETTREDRWARTRVAVIYALAFWGVGVAVNTAGIGLVVWVRGADHGMVIRIVGYLSYVIAAVAVMCRPGIAKGLKYPLRESFRIFRQNVFGATVTLILAALPLGLVFFGVTLISDFIRMKLYVALLLELPIAATSALCYFAFEGAVATLYRRVM